MRRTLDPVTLLAEMRAAQAELGERIDQRPGKCTARLPVPADTAVFAKTLGTSVAAVNYAGRTGGQSGITFGGSARHPCLIRTSPRSRAGSLKSRS